MLLLDELVGRFRNPLTADFLWEELLRSPDEEAEDEDRLSSLSLSRE